MGGERDYVGKQVQREGPQVALPQQIAPGKLTLSEPHAIAQEGTTGAGDQLPFHDKIQRSFGKHRIDGIRAFVGGKAAEATHRLDAHAYASGDRIAFGERPDEHTAAHEAAHVIQQQKGVSSAGGIDGGKDDPYERHADAVADAVVAGQSAESLLDNAPTGGGTGEPVVQRKEKSAKEKAADQLDKDRERLKRALDHLDELDERLGRELAQIGPALSSKDKLKYIRTFRQLPDYKKTLHEIKDAEHDLERDLKTAGGKGLDNDADHGQREAAEKLIETYKQLATSNMAGAKKAMLWAHDKVHEKGFRPKSDLHEIISEGEETFQEKLVAEVQKKIGSGDKKNLVKRITDAADHMMDELKTVKAVVKVGTLPSVISDFKKHVKGLDVKEAKQLVRAIEKESPVVTRIARSLFLSAAVAELFTDAEHALNALDDMRRHGEVLLQAMKGSKKIDRFKPQLARFATAAKLVGKFLPLLGAASSMQATVEDVIQAVHNPSPAHIAKAVGDFMQAVGQTIQIFGGKFNLLGDAIQIIGVAICGLVAFFSGPSQEIKDERAVLDQMGFTDNQIDAVTGGRRRNDEFSNSSQYNLANAQKYGVTPGVIKAAANRCPDIFSRERTIEQMHACYVWLRNGAQGGLEVSFNEFVDLASKSPVFRARHIEPLQSFEGRYTTHVGVGNPGFVDTLWWSWMVWHSHSFKQPPLYGWRVGILEQATPEGVERWKNWWRSK